MAKDPAFLFYPNDWIGGTMGMTFEEKGAYMELLMLQFNRGHMTTHMIGQTIGQLFGRIEDKFSKDSEGLWYNERLDVEKEKRKNYTQSRFNNKKGINQYKKDGGHMTYHMENVNENVNNSINKEDKLKERELIFYNQVAEFKEIYPKETLREFYDYWREPNKSKVSMRFEMQKTWDLNLRLKKWAKNDFSKNVKKEEIKQSIPMYKPMNELLEKYEK